MAVLRMFTTAMLLPPPSVPWGSVTLRTQRAGAGPSRLLRGQEQGSNTAWLGGGGGWQWTTAVGQSLLRLGQR